MIAMNEFFANYVNCPSWRSGWKMWVFFISKISYYKTNQPHPRSSTWNAQKPCAELISSKCLAIRNALAGLQVERFTIYSRCPSFLEDLEKHLHS